jgi:hypothetical protein
MSRPIDQKVEINYVVTVFGKIMVRMNTKTGMTWYYKDGWWLPVKEQKE